MNKVETTIQVIRHDNNLIEFADENGTTLFYIEHRRLTASAGAWRLKQYRVRWAGNNRPHSLCYSPSFGAFKEFVGTQIINALKRANKVWEDF